MQTSCKGHLLDLRAGHEPGGRPENQVSGAIAGPALPYSGLRPDESDRPLPQGLRCLSLREFFTRPLSIQSGIFRDAGAATPGSAENPNLLHPRAIQAPSEFWEDLQHKNLSELCDIALARQEDPETLTLDFLHTEIRVHPFQRKCFLKQDGQWQMIDHSLLELLILVYLLQVKPGWLFNETIAVQDLKDAQFFQGPHELKTHLLLERFGHDFEGFRLAAEKLGGIRLTMADISYKLRPFPKIPLYFLLWKGDEEFAPRVSVLFDRSIDLHLSADAIWGLVNLVCELLSRSDEKRP